GGFVAAIAVPSPQIFDPLDVVLKIPLFAGSNQPFCLFFIERPLCKIGNYRNHFSPESNRGIGWQGAFKWRGPNGRRIRGKRFSSSHIRSWAKIAFSSFTAKRMSSCTLFPFLGWTVNPFAWEINSTPRAANTLCNETSFSLSSEKIQNSEPFSQGTIP